MSHLTDEQLDVINRQLRSCRSLTTEDYTALIAQAREANTLQKQYDMLTKLYGRATQREERMQEALDIEKSVSLAAAGLIGSVTGLLPKLHPTIRKHLERHIRLIENAIAGEALAPLQTPPTAETPASAPLPWRKVSEGLPKPHDPMNFCPPLLVWWTPATSEGTFIINGVVDPTTQVVDDGNYRYLLSVVTHWIEITSPGEVPLSPPGTVAPPAAQPATQSWKCPKCKRWQSTAWDRCRSGFDTGIECDGQREQPATEAKGELWAERLAKEATDTLKAKGLLSRYEATRATIKRAIVAALVEAQAVAPGADGDAGK